jgi:glucokinase
MSAVAIGLDVGGHGINGVIVDAEGAVLDRSYVPLKGVSDRRLDVVEELILGLVGRLWGPVHDSLPVGAGIPGFHDRTTGLLRQSPNFPGWEDLPVAGRLSELLRTPVATDNDANVALLGEAWVGAAAGLNDVVMLTLGTGVGSGFLTGGRLLTGARGAGAEGGHIPLHVGGRVCGCGRRGCLEAYVSGPGLTRTGREEYDQDPAGLRPERPEDIFDAEQAGRAWASRAIGRFVEDLSGGLVTLVHLFSPEAIVIGGGVSGAFDRFAGPVERELTRRAIAACLAGALPLRAAALGGDAGAVGAARLALLSAAG